MDIAIARWVGAVFCALTLQAPIAPSSADGTNTTAGTVDHIAIQGYDTVAYFTEGKPVKGSSEFEVLFDDSIWRFSNASHKQMFAADPERYLPQYLGYCVSGLALGVSFPANPESWAIVDGKLYMVAGGQDDLEQWKQHAAESIKAADKIWAEKSFK
jgi:hypothetical protein